jgi:hypothetical protein
MSSLDADLAALTAAMDASMTGENGRRELASRMPGYGAQLPLEQPPNGPAVGKYGLPGLEVTGEGYDTVAEVSAAVTKAYGGDRPQYGDDLIGGVKFTAGRQEAPIRVYLGSRSAPADGITVVSPPLRPSLWRRLLRRG